MKKPLVLRTADYLVWLAPRNESPVSCLVWEKKGVKPSSLPPGPNKPLPFTFKPCPVQRRRAWSYRAAACRIGPSLSPLPPLRSPRGFEVQAWRLGERVVIANGPTLTLCYMQVDHQGTPHLSTQTLGITDRAEALPAQRAEGHHSPGMIPFKSPPQRAAGPAFPPFAI